MKSEADIIADETIPNFIDFDKSTDDHLVINYLKLGKDHKEQLSLFSEPIRGENVVKVFMEITHGKLIAEALLSNGDKLVVEIQNFPTNMVIE